jgi:CheY-like chemotaxis protein
VLVIDDDAAALDAAAGLLAGWGCSVGVATSESAAQRMIEQTGVPPDVIISDYELDQGARGTEVISLLRKRWGGSIPAILLTAHKTAHVVAEAQISGLHLLAKPLAPAKLRVLLQFLLNLAAERMPNGRSKSVLGGRGEQRVRIET